MELSWGVGGGGVGRYDRRSDSTYRSMNSAISLEQSIICATAS